MMTALDHPLVQDYLRRLRAEAHRLPVDDAHDLETQIREHLLAALDDDPAEAGVRETLDRLGEPSVLVGAAGTTAHDETAHDETPPDGTPHDDPRGPDGAWREVGGLVGLVGALLLVWLPVVNVVLWLGGLVLLVLARRWSVADKLWGAIVLGLGPWLVLAGGALAWFTTSQVCEVDAAGVETCVGSGGAGDGGLTALNVVAIALTVAFVGLYLWTLVRLARRAARPA